MTCFWVNIQKSSQYLLRPSGEGWDEGVKQLGIWMFTFLLFRVYDVISKTLIDRCNRKCTCQNLGLE